MRGINLIDHIRFALAPSRARREAIRNILIILGLFVIMGIVGRMDYEDQLQAQRQAAIDRSSMHQAALLACLNGGAPGLFTTDRQGVRHYIVCDPAFTVSDENIVRRGS